MIDKNDVKMPVEREDSAAEDRTPDEERDHIQKVELLLDLANEVESKRELRLDQNYYNTFHWFGYGTGERGGKSYFSYQEEAVYDFIFNLNKSGILSDQVGMGKTIEAGMIISELASRNELRSLLIVVPNEIMAAKWQDELSTKFGLKAHVSDGVVYPEARVLLSYEDFSRCVFDCVALEKFNALTKYSFKLAYDPAKFQDATLKQVMDTFVARDLKAAIRMINEGFEISEMDGNPQVEFDGKTFSIVEDVVEKGKKPPFERRVVLSQPYVPDPKGELKKFISEHAYVKTKEQLALAFRGNMIETRYRDKIILNELNSLYTLVGEYFTRHPDEIASIAEGMSVANPILIVPKSYTKREGGKFVTYEFLNRTLSSSEKIENYHHQYIVRGAKEGSERHRFYEDYRIMDFLIDVGYQTLIVDEVHDYIDVYAKVSSKEFHSNPERCMTEYPPEDFNRFELFDDYYFIKKESLYKKLKMLADRANRKIFLTATPIKSDMVDFYLLTLIASNKDADAYTKIRDYIDNLSARSKERDAEVENLFNMFAQSLDRAAEGFVDNAGNFFSLEDGRVEDNRIPDRDKRYRYPYFKNAFLRENAQNKERIHDYLLSQLDYSSVEETVLALILAYSEETKNASFTSGGKLFDRIMECLSRESGEQVRVVFRALLNNTIKLRFERDFTEVKYRIADKIVSESELTLELRNQIDGVVEEKPIKQIRQLLELKDGPRRWHKTYRSYGIRHTRHQTFNLSRCKSLSKFGRKKERYENLPFWPKRNGKVLYLQRVDCFFDSFLDVRREVGVIEEQPVEPADLPNFDKMLGTEENKLVRFEEAKSIFDYINTSMSGGTDDVHEPQSSRYEAIGISDENMVDYKLALVNRLMQGSDPELGSVKKKVLLFAENGREAIQEWFRYQGCKPLLKPGEQLDPAKLAEYQKKWKLYDVRPVGATWNVSDNTGDMDKFPNDLLIIIDPSRYEKGVDLQKAETIINFDLNYDPLKMEQRIGRIDRIRPLGQSQEINIISFVPFNDMSGFVINFFANEMKMFTQWMGETTGIVSVLDDADAGKSKDVSFGGKVDSLEKFYKDVYKLCTVDVKPAEIAEKASEFRAFFKSTVSQLKESAEQTEETQKLIAGFGVSEKKTEYDFGFVNALRGPFDRIFRNSISPNREGYLVGTERFMRFNSHRGYRNACPGKGTCESCPDKADCRSKEKPLWNSCAEFSQAVKDFFSEGEKYYEKRRAEYGKEQRLISGLGATDNTLDDLRARKELFAKTKAEVEKLLPVEKKEGEPFLLPIERFDKIFAPIKKLYWDDVVDVYLRLILHVFHQQCDNVLKGAKLFERFIKIFSIAEFMNNMEADN